MFVRASGLMLTSETVDTALAVITSLAHETFPGSAGGRPHPDRRVTQTATDPLVRRADGVQHELGAGPCLAAWHQRTVVRIDDTSHDDRWPAQKRWAR